MSDPRVEAVAREMCREEGRDPEGLFPPGIIWWTLHINRAKRWLAAADAVDPVRRALDDVLEQQLETYAYMPFDG